MESNSYRQITAFTKNDRRVLLLEARDMSEAKRITGVKTRAKVIKAASEIFCQEGYSGASMSKIAKSAGVLAGSIYWLFDSKEHLFAEVLKEASEEWLTLLRDGTTSTPANVEEFRQLYQSVVKHSESTPQFVQLIFVVASESSARTERTLEVVREVRRFWRQRAEKMIIENVIGEDTERSRLLAKKIASLSVYLIDGVYISLQFESNNDKYLSLMTEVSDVLIRELNSGIEELNA